MVNKFDLSDFEFIVASWIIPEGSEFKNDGNRMLPVNSFDNYSLWADSTETISRSDRIECLFIAILHIYRGIINMYFTCN